MSVLRKLFFSLLICISIAILGGYLAVKPAIAMTQSFQWAGRAGYSARGEFSYDETKVSSTIAEHGVGKTNILQSLIVTFYNPAGETISSYHNVVDGMAGGNYFEFHFDPATQKLFGSIDIGGALAGEMYLKGEIDRELALIEVEKSGIDRTLDTDNGLVETQDLASLQVLLTQKLF